MAIIVVNEIPKPVRPVKTEPVNYRGKVNADLEYAWNEHIAKFEFVGYNSNNSAAQFAREEAYKIYKSKVLTSTIKRVEETIRTRLKRKLGGATKYIRVNLRSTAEPAITISGVTVSGVKRLFGEIDWDYIDNLYETLLDTNLKKYSDKNVIAELKDKWVREKEAIRGKKRH
jgi:hypothetical protein